MLKFSSCVFISVLTIVAVSLDQTVARPRRRVPVQTLVRRSGVNDSTISYIKRIPSNNLTRDENNKTKTRILFRGELLEGDQDIIFPDTYQIYFESVPKINNTPKCAKGKTFCENLDSYPYQQVKEILNRKHIHTDLFGKDEIPDESYSITNRNSDFEAFVCTSIQKTIFPRVGKNKSNKWKFIINQEEDEGYIQGIRIEVCRKEGSACDLIGERINGYITSCKQKYMLRRLMSLTENGEAAPDTFQLPSACCCSYRKDLSFLSRFGSDEVSARIKIKT